MAVFSPDGREVAFISERTGEREIFLKEIDSALPPMPTAAKAMMVTDWSSDGRYLVHNDGEFGLTISEISREEESSVRLEPLEFKYSGNQGSLSPRGRWLAHTSKESGTNEIYVESFPPGFKKKISTAGGVIARWRPDGRELFYLQLSGTALPGGIIRRAGGGESMSLMAAAIEKATDQFQARAPERLFDFPQHRYAHFTYAPTADGQRFLVIQNVEDRAPTRFVVDTDWMLRVGTRD